MKRINQILILVGLVSSLNTVMAVENENSSSADKAMTRTVKGHVTDRISGEALTGVAVKINNSNETVYTDFEGNFEIENVVPGQYELSVSFISYKNIDQVLKVDRLNDNNVNLEIEPLVK